MNESAVKQALNILLKELWISTYENLAQMNPNA